MGRNRFPKPETTTLQLSDGDWIEVKTTPTVGEDHEFQGAKYGTVNPDGSRRVDNAAVQRGLEALYLVDWSFTAPDEKGVAQKVPVPESFGDRVKLLGQLDKASFHEIEKAIGDFVKANAVAPGAGKDGEPVGNVRPAGEAGS